MRQARGSGISDAERQRALPGDEIVPGARLVMDRAFDLPAAPQVVWPWLLQLGKRRAGWYLPAALERWAVPRARRGARRIVPELQHLAVGDEVPDWGPGDPRFEVHTLDPPHTLVYRSERPRGSREPMRLSWALVLRPGTNGGTRVHLRLRVNRLVSRWPRLAAAAGDLLDRVTVELLRRGLHERLRS